MTLHEKLAEFPLFDIAVLHHGFVPYLRDYELLTETDWAGDLGGRYQYLFTHCVAVSYETRVLDHVWPRSWSDEFIDYQHWLDAGEPEGYVWGANWALAYPGWEFVEDSERAREWTERLGQSMYEGVLETNAYYLRLVFHDVRITKISDETGLMRQVSIPLE